MRLRSGVLTLMLALTLTAIAGNAAGDTPATPQRLAVYPPVGGSSTIVRVHFVADAADESSGDQVQVTGPDGTPCAGDVIVQYIYGPNQQDGSGPVTVYMGPGADRAYVWAGYAYDPEFLGVSTPLSHWCTGVYEGEVWGPDPYVPTLKATFEFRISATKHTTLPTIVAAQLRPVRVSPARGTRRTVFAVRYRADSGPYDSGDVVQVDGPSHSSCKGTVVRAGDGRGDQRRRPLTLHIGPGSAYPPDGDNGTGKPLRRWCSGTYKGTIFYEHGPKFTVIARFKLTVAK
jgi:hypothetical protein